MHTNEPVAIGAFAASILSAVTIFANLGLSDDQQGAVVTVIILLSGLFTRSKVKPIA